MTTTAFPAMGCQVKVVLENKGDCSETSLKVVPQWFADWENVLSRFLPESELNRLHNSEGKTRRLTPILGEVLEESIRAAKFTGGLVTPFVHEALLNAGYDQPFAKLGNSVSEFAVGKVSVPGWDAIHWDRKSRRIRLGKGARLDFGGIAKGWAADRASTKLNRNGSVLVDAGGDISVRGLRVDGSPWPIGVANPFAAGEMLCILALANGGVATSGRDYRKWIQNGRPRHHIIDPRTGEPAETDVLTATVVSSSARRAEAAAKAALILGSVRGIQWLNRHSDLAGMLVLEDQRIVYSHRFADYVWS